MVGLEVLPDVPAESHALPWVVLPSPASLSRRHQGRQFFQAPARGTLPLLAAARCPMLCAAAVPAVSGVGGASRNGSLYACGFTSRLSRPCSAQEPGIVDDDSSQQWMFDGPESQSELTARSSLVSSEGITELSSTGYRSPTHSRSTDTSDHPCEGVCGGGHPDDGAGVWDWLLRDCAAGEEESSEGGLGRGASPPLSARSPTSTDDDATTTASTPSASQRRREGEVPATSLASFCRGNRRRCCECCGRGHGKGGGGGGERKDASWIVEDDCLRGDVSPRGTQLAAT